MHDSAYQIGELVMRTYCDLSHARILEIGSMNVNGGLRDIAEPTTHYVGVDLEEGPGVDVVVKAGEKLPVEDDSFDLAMASSAFEHDPRFWETFIEMCRVVQPGGHIYVNAPSNGGVHRYPLDCWRFYPDAGLALVEYVHTIGIDIELVESFVGKRFADTWDGWNDFVAIFRKGPSDIPMLDNFVYERYPSYNVRTWNSSAILSETGLTEDMQLGRDLRQQLADRNNDLVVASTELGTIREKLDGAERQLDQHLEVIRHHLGSIEVLSREKVEVERQRERLSGKLEISEAEAERLRSTVLGIERQVEALTTGLQTQNEAFARMQERDQVAVASLHVELGDVRERLSLAESSLNQQQKEITHHLGVIDQLSREKVEGEGLTRKLSDELRLSEVEAAGLRSATGSLERQIQVLEAVLQRKRDESAWEQERSQGVIASLHAEIVGLRSEHLSQLNHVSAEITHLRARDRELDAIIKNENRRAQGYQTEMDWLRAVHMALARRPFWWFLLPSPRRWAREHKLLHDAGLFDAQSYLARYDDVAVQGAEPLCHYITYGINEGRSRK